MEQHDAGPEIQAVSGADIFDDNVIERHLRAKGLAGPIDRKFLEDTRWGVLGMAVAEAVREAGDYPAGIDGAQAFMDELLAVPDAAAAAKIASGTRLATFARKVVGIADRMVAA